MAYLFRASLFILLATFLVSCSWWNPQRTGSSSSLVDYLYPNGEVPPDLDERIPVINIPARVGIAFVPSHGWGELGEADKTELLGIVRDRFADREFIERIEVIPSNYLRAKGGFEGLEQVGRLYNVDIIALVSYDQVLNMQDRASSMLYWTIVGAYVIKGTSNEVTTFVDTAVFDLATRRMLFRAPGVDESSRRSTGVNSGEVGREVSHESFETAMNEMTLNLDRELERFRERIKEDQSVQIAHRGGGGGTGSLDLAFLLLALAGFAVAGVSRKR